MNLCKSFFRKSCEIFTKKSHPALTVSSRNWNSSFNLADFSTERIRNFGIIAHVDHGKSTIADRLLEFTGTIERSKNNKQVLDKLQVERERGITVKAQTASMIYKHENQDYLLNLIDTPGHVDFSYEVSRSLSACQGVLLVVDASQGIQAQTLANFYLAMENEIQIIPVINKIDLKTANIARVKQELQKLMDIDPNDVICVSAKQGTNIGDVLKAIVNRLPSPCLADSSSYNRDANLKALLFDSNFENHKGVIANVLVVDGVLKKGEKITSEFLQEHAEKGKKGYEIKEIGILKPDNFPVETLFAGQVGYIICGMKKTSEAQIGDTFFHPNLPVPPLPGFTKVKPVVFGGMFPIDQSEYKALEAALNRLTLNDRSVTIEPAASTVLGAGFRVGFLGLLHMDVFQQRLEQEYNATVVMTSPSVVYKAILKPSKKRKEPEEILIRMPTDFPDKIRVSEYFHPMIIATVLTPKQFEGAVSNLCMERDGVEVGNSAINDYRIMLQYRMPMSEVMVDFYDKLKSITSGYASFDYEEDGYDVTNLVKLDFLLNGSSIEELSNVCPSHKARYLGSKMCVRLKELLPRQPYPVAIQAAVGGTVIARETMSALKKDVLAKCSGGDYTRKLKLLRRHAQTQKILKEQGSIGIPKNLFIDILK